MLKLVLRLFPPSAVYPLPFVSPSLPSSFSHSLREKQLSASHHVEMESLASQHKHQTQLLLADFNQAKELLNRRLSELEKQ